MDRRTVRAGSILVVLVLSLACGPPMVAVRDGDDVATAAPPGQDLSAVPLSAAGPWDEVDGRLFAKLALFYQVLGASGDDPWDGLYRPDEWPLLFVRADALGRPMYGYLVNVSSPPTGAVSLSPNPDGLPDVYRVEEGLDAFADPDYYFDFFFPLGDLDVLAVRYQEGEDDPANPEWLPYVVHEGFHRFQEETWGEPQEWDQEVDYPLVAENVALALLEQRILLAGLDGAEDEAADLLKMFVAVRSERMDRYPAVRVLDNPQEWSEGTADYVERRFAALAGIEDVFPLRESLEETLRAREEWLVETFTWDRFYATGDALGVLTDRAGISWRAAMAEGRCQHDVLAAVFSLSAAERDGLLAQAKDRFDFSSLSNQAEGLTD